MYLLDRRLGGLRCQFRRRGQENILVLARDRTSVVQSVIIQSLPTLYNYKYVVREIILLHWDHTRYINTKRSYLLLKQVVLIVTTGFEELNSLVMSVQCDTYVGRPASRKMIEKVVDSNEICTCIKNQYLIRGIFCRKRSFYTKSRDLMFLWLGGVVRSASTNEIISL